MQSIDKSPQSEARINTLVLIAVMLSTFMEVLDTSVVNVSFPHIAGSLSATRDEATWVLSSYIVANAMVIPLSGWLTERFGRKRLLLNTVACFTVASVACCFATSLNMLVVLRVLQGLTGGGLQAMSYSVILETFPKDKVKGAMNWWTLGIICAPLFGPAVGGWLTENRSWRWIFGINLPIGIISWLMVKAFLTETKRVSTNTKMRLDWISVALLFTGMGTLQIVLDKGQILDWFGSISIRWMSAIAVVTLVLFIWRQLTAENPIVKLRLLKDVTFAAGCAGMFILCAVMYASLVLLPEFMQGLLGYDALKTGIFSSPRGLTMIIGIFALKIPWIARRNKQVLITFGAGLVCWSMWGYSHMNLSSTSLSILWCQLLQGLGTALVFTLMNGTVMATLPVSESPYASSLYSMMRNIGSAVGVAFVSTYLARQSQTHQVYLGAAMNHVKAKEMLNAITHGLVQHGASYQTAHHQAQTLIYGMLQQQATLLSFSDSYRIAAICFTLIIPVAWYSQITGLVKQIRQNKRGV